MPNISVTLVQFKIAWQNAAKNRKKIEKLLSASDTGDLIVLPETFSTGFSMEASKLAEKIGGDTLYWMSKLAKQHDAVVTGSLIIEENAKFYNRLIWMRPDGSYETYNKRHLFRMAGEDERFSEGDQKIYPVLKGWRVCPLICYDLRFPVWSRNQNDYDLLIYIANWPAVRKEAWNTLSKARAIENLAPVVCVNRVGSDGNGIEYEGNSAVYNAKGETVLKMTEKEESVQTVVLKIKELKEYREKFPAYLDADSFAIQE